MSDYLFEIGTQELPAGAIDSLVSQLKEFFIVNLKENNLKFKEIQTYSTPRRLTVFVRSLENDTVNSIKTVKGPLRSNCYGENGKPSNAFSGFMKKYDLKEKDIEFKSFGNLEYAVAQIQMQSADIKTSLANISVKSINSLNCERPMRWANSKLKFLRPIDWILALFNNEVVSFEVEDIKSGSISYGHRLGQPVVIDNCDNYLLRLKENGVIADSCDRQRIILDQIVKILPEAGAASYLADKSLIEEICNLVENPKVIVASFDKEFLSLPSVLITTIMIHHQRYIPLFDASGKLMSNFLVVSNNPNEKSFENTVKGNERVIRARLADGKFFFEEDSKIDFLSLGHKLSSLTFQDELGSMAEKTKRLKLLNHKLTNSINDSAISKLLEEAISLCKLDLTTNMVRELPELQGIVASWYANNNGSLVNHDILIAVAEHYKPLSTEDSLPSTMPGKYLSLLDKLDNLCSFFIIGKKPTGSGDPFALRRQAMGIVDILIDLTIDYGHTIDLSALIDFNFNLVVDDIKFPKLAQKVDKQHLQIKTEVEEFLNLRIRNLLAQQNYNLNLIEAIEQIISPLQDYKGFFNRLKSLSQLLEHTNNYPIFKSGIRVANIVDYKVAGIVNSDLLNNELEANLWSSFNRNIVDKWSSDSSLSNVDEISNYLLSFNTLVTPLEEFFNGVMVNDTDNSIKVNRHSILAAINDCFLKVADFKKIQSLIPVILCFFLFHHYRF